MMTVFTAHHAFAQIEENIEEESDSLLFLDSLILTKQTIDFDPAFNYNLDSTLVPNDSYIRAGLLYDIENNTVVWQKDMNYAYPVASVTKIMTSLLTFLDIEAGLVCWDDPIKVTSKYYKGKGRKKRAYTATSYYTLQDILKMAMIESNNMASNLLAQHVGKGNMPAFVKRMNDYALAIGMKSTFYSNPSGLPSPHHEMDNSSSPHDLLLLALEALKFPELSGIASMGYANVSNGKSTYTIRNHNSLVRDYQYEIDGLKTGFTRAAGFCIVVTSNRYNHRLVSIVLGAPSTWSRNAIVAQMINRYYEKINLGMMGTRISDSLLAIVKPGLTNDMFNMRPGSVQQITSKSNFDASSEIVFRTTYQKTVKYHKVHSGETLSHVADHYDCSVNDLKKWNHLRSSKIMKGQKLKVYATVKRVVPVTVDKSSLALKNDSIKEEHIKTESSDTVIAAKKQPIKKEVKEVPKTSKSNYVIHVVQPGDTLWNIAQKYSGVTVNDLKKYNRSINAKSLLPGTKVKVPVNP